MMATLGYLIHDYTDQTSEGFGSHSRGVLFPLLHIAIVNRLQPIFSEETYAVNTARDYSQLSVTDFLGLSHNISQSEYNDCEELEINTWSDPTIGSACGDANLLAVLIHDYLQDVKQDDKKVVIKLVGSLRYMSPSTEVWNWLQQRQALCWSKQHEGRKLRIAAHVRVPEDFCPQSWKDENHVSKLIWALEVMEIKGLIGVDQCELEIYTEERFSENDEELLRERYPLSKVIRGSEDSLLQDVQRMSTADIFIPSSSHFSAFAGYLSHGVIVLSDSSRWEYFKPHAELGNHVVDIVELENLVDTTIKSNPPANQNSWIKDATLRPTIV